MRTTEEEKKLRDLQEKAVEACIAHYTRHGGYFQMAKAVEAYMAEEVGYKGNPGFVIGHRQIAAQEIAIKCITSLTRDQMARLDMELRHIWKNPEWPDERRSIGRGL
jgi:hypothetical protein